MYGYREHNPTRWVRTGLIFALGVLILVFAHYATVPVRHGPLNTRVVGSEVILERSEFSSVPVCVTLEVLKEWQVYSRAFDDEGLSGLRATGLVWFVASGVRVRVLVPGTTFRVRILEGRHAGKEGYVPNEFVCGT